MRKRRSIELVSLSFLDVLSGALGAVIILYVAMPKSLNKDTPGIDLAKIQLQKDYASSQDELKKLQDELIETKALLAKASVKPIPGPVLTHESKTGFDLDIGFNFKGKNILFVIDTSYSMLEEDRMVQVKAGLKMLLTSLPATYKIDIIQYPLGERAPLRTMWGDVKSSTSFNKIDAFDFIFSLRPAGGTPTREALLFALKNYETISDIVLLSDGAPTFHNSNQKDDIYDI